MALPYTERAIREDKLRDKTIEDELVVAIARFLRYYSMRGHEQPRMNLRDSVNTARVIIKTLVLLLLS